MGRLTARWRRFWGVRPGEPQQQPEVVGHRRTMGGPRSVTRARGWEDRRHELEEVEADRERRPPKVTRRPRRSLEFPVSVVADEWVGEQAREQAKTALGRSARHAHRPVLQGRISIRELRDPKLERPAIVKASLDVGGRPVRAHVAAGTVREAIDLVEARLRRNLDDLESLRRGKRREREAQPEYRRRPPEERELARRKTLALSACTLSDATLELQALDYDFLLFLNEASGEENVVYHGPDGAIALEERPAGVLTLEEAGERLDVSSEPFLFFVDPETRRSRLLYRRYDGNYGLIEPAPPKTA